MNELPPDDEPRPDTLEDDPRDDAGEPSPARVRASDRAVAALVCGAVSVALVSVVALLPVPFAVEGPGPVRDVLSGEGDQRLITISGAPTYPTSGSLDLTTVRVSGGPGRSLDLGGQVAAWLDDDSAVLPEAAVFPPGATEKQVDDSNAAALTDSQQAATVAALTELGYDVPVQVVVSDVVDGAGAAGVLRDGDVVVAVGGAAVADASALREAVRAAGVGADVRVQVERNGQRQDLTVPVRAGDGGAPVLGVLVRERADPPVDVTIAVDQIGGPSAGLMFALGVVDLMTPGEMTGGKRFAGTGTIDSAGEVGPIGGIRQKMLGARAAGAEVFLAPQANCDEVVGHVPEGLRVVAVSTLAQARDAVEAAGRGEAGGLPGCV
ncbi:PDZ domain-containing protein [Quadrisphaera granulorum]|uniref:endopeptidase La n=1 Tax=Quadrisphaera granulorum TaxID=317664 RepID=A0A316AAX7_9ACTN|nr:PDZ domain-containing protein [Quadrisphaera granulorum]PWJ54853.1 PDZ domain-containing protein [Quadrisphaera granulorum]SZE95799.1 PDZ domain-containing protein [Quadrisphaera granulorum]